MCWEKTFLSRKINFTKQIKVFLYKISYYHRCFFDLFYIMPSYGMFLYNNFWIIIWRYITLYCHIHSGCRYFKFPGYCMCLVGRKAFLSISFCVNMFNIICIKQFLCCLQRYTSTKIFTSNITHKPLIWLLSYSQCSSNGTNNKAEYRVTFNSGLPLFVIILI